MVSLKHNMNNKDKIEFTKRRVLWSHTACLEESCLRVFDVNQCMKHRSNWPGVTLKFALFNHVFDVRCIKKRSFVVNILLPLLHEADFLTKVWETICCSFSYRKKHCCLLCKTLQRTETGWEEKPKQLVCYYLHKHWDSAPNYHQMDRTERSLISFLSHDTNATLGISMLVFASSVYCSPE